MNGSEEKGTQVIGLYGEMRLAMELHNRRWQVYRAYIDEKFDFVILKSYCENCKAFRGAWKREKTVTQLCETCHKDELKMLVRFIQVKTSEGTEEETRPAEEGKRFDFHPKIRYHLKDSRVFYVWIQVWDADRHDINYYIFKTEDIALFNDLSLKSYQETDNQKIGLSMNKAGKVVTEGTKYDYNVFEKFLNNFECLEKATEDDPWK